MPGVSPNQTGTAASLGAPSTTPFNGLVAVQDAFVRSPIHALSGSAGTLPTALKNENKPYIPGVKVLTRRDAVILYVPNVAGAEDYRAYAVKNGLAFTSTANGQQPRGAVITCAGYRQHTYESLTVSGYHTRELQQAIEVPGFTTDGDYTIVVEAITTPCPFVGLPGAFDANINARLQYAVETNHSYKIGNFHSVVRSLDAVKAQYGNEILNGQGSLNSWTNRENGTTIATQDPQGLAVPANSTVIPKDPVVIARSAIAVRLPAEDEFANAPILDMGANAVWDDFKNDYVVQPSAIHFDNIFHPESTGTLSDGGGAQSLSAVIPGAWAFWSRHVQLADQDIVQPHKISDFVSLQIFQRHGRLYTAFGDWIQDNPGTVQFSSLKTLPLLIDGTKYAHSFFRVNSSATPRRYWTWMICGGATRDELVDVNTHMPKIHPVANQFMFVPGSVNANPSNPTAKFANMASEPPMPTGFYNKECLSIIQHGRAEPARTDGRVRTGSRILAQIHPAGDENHIIALGNTLTDFPVAGNDSNLGFRNKTDASGAYAGPIMDPFDQEQPLTHFDIYLRKDRLLFFINGRQAFCVDMTDRPLTMKYGLVVYGDFMYHSGLDWKEMSSDPNTDEHRAMYHNLLNAPISSSRIWDLVGESDNVASIPTQFSTLDLSQCRKPATSAPQ